MHSARPGLGLVLVLVFGLVLVLVSGLVLVLALGLGLGLGLVLVLGWVTYLHRAHAQHPSGHPLPTAPSPAWRCWCW